MEIAKIKVRRRGKPRKASVNCYNCLNASKISLTTGRLPDGQVFCTVWQCVVSCTHARICPHFTPVEMRRRRRDERWKKGKGLKRLGRKV